MAPRHQLHLGPSRTNSLAIIEVDSPSPLASTGSSYGTPKRTTAQSRWPSGEQPTKNSLFQLPDELLAHIVELAISEDGSQNRKQRRTVCHNRIARILTKVCHRLRRLARPLLLRDIRIEYPNQVVPPSISVKNLHRTLRDRPHLRKHCR